MKNLTIPDPGDPGTWEYDAEQPTYQTEYASWYCLKLFHAIAGQSFSLRQVEDSDIDAQVASIDSWASSTKNWITGVFEAYNTGDFILEPPSLNALSSSLLAVIPTSMWGILLRVIVNIALSKLYSALLKKVGPESGKGDNSSLNDLFEKALLDKDGERFLDAAFCKLSEEGEIQAAFLDLLNAAGLTLNINGQETTVEYAQPVV